MPSVATMKIARTERKNGVLEFKAPEVLKGKVELVVQVRAGTENQHDPIGPKRGKDAFSQSIPDAKLQAEDEVVVDVIVVLKQPANMESSVKLSGTLTVNGRSKDTDTTISLKAGDDSEIGTLTWWLEVP